MSNKNKWVKSLKLKRSVKVDLIFKSYWIRKFLSKITKHSKRMKTENFLQKILLNLKKLQISKISKLLDYPKSKYLYNGSKSIIKKKQVYFRSLRVMTSYNFSNKDKSDEEAEGTTEYFCPRNFNNFTISKFIIFRSNYFRIKNRFLKRIHKNVSFRPILETFNKFYKNFNRTMFAEIDDYHVDNKKPVAYILRAIDKIRWIFTTQLRRMGKYFHSIPTTITFPRTINYGLKKLAFILSTNVKNKSYLKKLNLEIFCILFRFKKSISRHIRRLKLKFVKKNAPYSHFRWK